MKVVRRKKESEIAHEWDDIAQIRDKQIESGIDISFHHVLTPCLEKLWTGSDFTKAIDIGCGTGFHCKELALLSPKVVGVDLSEKSIEIAKSRLGNFNNIALYNSSIEEFAVSQNCNDFSLAIANMTLITTVELEKTSSSIAKIMKPGGTFIFTISHPWFWPDYWGYSKKDWFDYKEEIYIEAAFKISLSPSTNSYTTHIHRPLEQYVTALTSSGFLIKEMYEPIPAPEIEKKYPIPWRYPRFLGMKCELHK